MLDKTLIPVKADAAVRMSDPKRPTIGSVGGSLLTPSSSFARPEFFNPGVTRNAFNASARSDWGSGMLLRLNCQIGKLGPRNSRPSSPPRQQLQDLPHVGLDLCEVARDRMRVRARLHLLGFTLKPSLEPRGLCE